MTPTVPGTGTLVAAGVSRLLGLAFLGMVTVPMLLPTYTDLRARYEPCTAADLFR